MKNTLKTSLYDDFEYLWRKNIKSHPLTKELKFHPGRKWRFDYALERFKLAFEVEGGVWSQGRHNRPIGFINDCEKYNEAALFGWRLFRITHFGSTRKKTNEIIEMLILKIKKEYLTNISLPDII